MGYTQFLLEYCFVIITLIIFLSIPRYYKAFWTFDPDKNKNHSIRFRSIDALKGVSILAVIIIHACYILLSRYNGFDETITLILINNIFRFAIPVFLFSSGLLLSKFIWKTKDIFYFYMSKFIRIGVPYLMVNLVLWQIGYNTSAPFWKLILTGDMAVPFYFIPVIFQLYVLYPVLDYFRHISPRYLLLISLIISLVSFSLPATWQINGFPLFFQYLVFFVYGMLRQDVLKQKSIGVWIELLLIYIILQTILILSLFFIPVDNNFLESIYFYNFQIILGFGFIFTILKYFQSNTVWAKIFQLIFAPIGRVSLWIFLLHFPIQQALFNINHNTKLPFLIDLGQNIILTLIITIPIALALNYLYSIPKFPKL